MNGKAAKFLILVAMSLVLHTGLLTAETKKPDIYTGYYSREGNDGRAAEVSGNSLFIKFYPDGWVVLLYIPYPYSKSVPPENVGKVFENTKRETPAYIKGKFDVLQENAIVHTERFDWTGKNEVRFECDGMAPCRARFEGETMDLIKAGIISNHIIRFRRVK